MNDLTPEEKRVIIYKGTEAPFSGEYVYTREDGIYVCKQCDAPLYSSLNKFDSKCGWPTFDDEITEGAVVKTKDSLGVKIQISCSKCGGHLGHVFEGERLTEKNIRHCVNSISLKFIPGDTQPPEKP